jgi:hypothetical protein
MRTSCNSGRLVVTLSLATLLLSAAVAVVLASISSAGAQQATAETQKPAPTSLLDIEPALNRWRLMEPLGVGERARNPLYDPYNPNVLKGDYPLFGDKVFFATTAVLDAFGDFKSNLDFTKRIRNVPFTTRSASSPGRSPSRCSTGTRCSSRRTGPFA